MPFKNPHPLYATWVNMNQRCSNPRLPNYPDYGGRGIYVCGRWKSSFANFVEDMGERPAGHSIDRIDNDGPYSPENCRWAPRKVQNRNMRRTRKVFADGVEYVAADIAERAGLKTDTVIKRALRGLSIESIATPEKSGYDISRHSGDKAGVAKRVSRSRSRAQCRNGHPWPEFQRFNKYGAVECIQCGRDKAMRSKRKRLGIA